MADVSDFYGMDADTGSTNTGDLGGIWGAAISFNYDTEYNQPTTSGSTSSNAIQAMTAGNGAQDSGDAWGGWWGAARGAIGDVLGLATAYQRAQQAQRVSQVNGPGGNVNPGAQAGQALPVSRAGLTITPQMLIGGLAVFLVLKMAK